MSVGGRPSASACPLDATSARISASARSGCGVWWTTPNEYARSYDSPARTVVSSSAFAWTKRIRSATLHHLRPLRRDAERFARQLDGRDIGPGTSEIDRCRSRCHIPPRARACPASARTRRRPGCAAPQGTCAHSTSSKYSREPTGFGEWRTLQGRASQYRRTSAMDLFVEFLTIRLPSSALWTWQTETIPLTNALRKDRKTVP